MTYLLTIIYLSGDRAYFRCSDRATADAQLAICDADKSIRIAFIEEV